MSLFLVNVVTACRLVYRKGVDLLAGIMKRMRDMPNVKLIVGGDGPKRDLLEEIREKENLQDRVTMLGALEHSKVKGYQNSYNFSLFIRWFSLICR